MTDTPYDAETGVLTVNGENFNKLISGSKPVIVDFWAEWCGPCRFMVPVFERLSKKYGGKILFARLNVDDNPGIASRYSVYSIPTFIHFNAGKPVNQMVGATSDVEMSKFIDSSFQK